MALIASWLTLAGPCASGKRGDIFHRPASLSYFLGLICGMRVPGSVWWARSRLHLDPAGAARGGSRAQASEGQVISAFLLDPLASSGLDLETVRGTMPWPSPSTRTPSTPLHLDAYSPVATGSVCSRWPRRSRTRSSGSRTGTYASRRRWPSGGATCLRPTRPSPSRYNRHTESLLITLRNPLSRLMGP